MLFGTLGAISLESMLIRKGIIIAGYGSEDLQVKKGKGIIRAGIDPRIFNSFSSFN